MKSERGIGTIAFIFCVLVIGAFVAFSVYLIKIDNVVRAKFEGQRWDIPAKVFARPLEIYTNAPVSQDDLREELKMLGYAGAESYAKTGSSWFPAMKCTCIPAALTLATGWSLNRF